MKLMRSLVRSAIFSAFSKAMFSDNYDRRHHIKGISDEEDGDFERAVADTNSNAYFLSDRPDPLNLSQLEDHWEHFKMAFRQSEGITDILVSRDTILEDAIRRLNQLSPHDLKKKINVTFIGEEGLDAGGPGREFFTLVARELFSPAFGLFTYGSSMNNKLQINRESKLTYRSDPKRFAAAWRFVGRFLGLAIAERAILSTFLSNAFFKVLLEEPVRLRDLQSIDRTEYESMLEVGKMVSDDEFRNLDMTFSIDQLVNGEMETIELCEDGSNMQVTSENKMEYLRLVIDYVARKSLVVQYGLIKQGLYQVVPKEALKIFSPKELVVLIGGSPTIDVEDWKKYTFYPFGSKDQEAVKCFWEFVESATEEERSNLLLFVTGCTHPPVTGFKDLIGMYGALQEFKIKVIDGSVLTSNSCTNSISLPRELSCPELKLTLQNAVDDPTGFSMA